LIDPTQQCRRTSRGVCAGSDLEAALTDMKKSGELKGLVLALSAPISPVATVVLPLDSRSTT